MGLIYKPDGKAGEYSEWACNFYNGCSNGCSYCYLKKGNYAYHCGGNKARLKSLLSDEQSAIQVFRRELERNITELRKNGIFFSFTTDPCLPETIGLTLWATQICQQYGVPVKILTKCDVLKNDTAGELIKMPNRELIAIGFTLTGHDVLEPNTSPNINRIAQMKQFRKLGFPTFASVEPIISFSSAKEMIGEAKDFCDLFMIGLDDDKKYNLTEARDFVQWLTYLNRPKLYLKESLQRLLLCSNKNLNSNFVESNYSLFPSYTDEILEALF